MLPSVGRLKRLALPLFCLCAFVGPPTASAQTTIGDILTRPGAGPRATVREGQSTEAESGPVVQAAVGDVAAPVRPEPFGASLFRNAVAASSEAVNPDYVIQPGDRIGLSVLGGPGAAGGTTTTLTVDPQGNIFVPDVGPVKVAGTRSNQLQALIGQQASRVFTNRVEVYAVLQTAQRVGVFVTGFVKQPGRYAGTASDSALDYLVRAGGVDPSRGSYRNIALIRGQEVIGRIDLYDFLLNGRLPSAPLREGDTLLVSGQSAMVEVQGAVRNAYLFELPRPGPVGAEVIGLARPLPSATHAVLSGSRSNKPFSSYLTLAELSRTPVQDQDRITFVGDAAATTIRVSVEGSRVGPSVLVLPNDNRLAAALAQITLDPALADARSVYILRPSIAEQQKRVIEEALDRLQRQLYLARSATTGVSTIRQAEAQMISNYIQRARRVTPDGRVVVTDEAGQLADVRLEDNDVIVIPRKSQVIMVAGEVLAPQAVIYRPELRPEDYIVQAGGFSERGRKGKLLVRRANGQIVADRKPTLRPGDELIVLPYIDPKLFQVGTDLMSLVYQVAVSAAAIHTVTN